MRESARAWSDAIADLDGRAEAPGLVALALPTPTLPPASTTNHWLVGWKRMVVVDPATPDRRAQRRLAHLVDAARQAGAEPVALLLSHHHLDHCGAAADLAGQLRLPVWCHAATRPLLPAWVEVAGEVAEDDEVAVNADGAVWRALHTPGHAPGHLVLHEPLSGWMVAGDMVAGQGTILIDPRDGDMGQYLASLERMQELAPHALAPAHGPVLREATQVLAYYQRHRREREARILASLTNLPREPAELLPSAYADVPRMTWPLALRSLESHLIHLQQQGLAHRNLSGWMAKKG